MEVNEAGPESFKYMVMEKSELFYSDDDLNKFTNPVRL